MKWKLQNLLPFSPPGIFDTPKENKLKDTRIMFYKNHLNINDKVSDATHCTQEWSICDL